MKIIQVVVLIAICGAVNAGGSYQPVKVLQFSTYEDGRYLLVVKPQLRADSDYQDPYMNGCPVFSIIGEYEGKGMFESGYIPAKKKHYEALEYLRSQDFMLLGWMGQGFRVLNTDDPCLVSSRALELVEIDGDKAVLSWYVGT